VSGRRKAPSCPHDCSGVRDRHTPARAPSWTTPRRSASPSMRPAGGQGGLRRPGVRHADRGIRSRGWGHGERCRVDSRDIAVPLREVNDVDHGGSWCLGGWGCGDDCRPPTAPARPRGAHGGGRRPRSAASSAVEGRTGADPCSVGEGVVGAIARQRRRGCYGVCRCEGETGDQVAGLVAGPVDGAPAALALDRFVTGCQTIPGSI